MVYILVRLNSAKTEMSSNSKVGQKIRFQKILVAIDGSDASMDAADYAISISKEYDTELYALHVPRVYSEDKDPVICPKCKSPYWNKPKATANK